jgi:hypothetical protein
LINLSVCLPAGILNNAVEIVKHQPLMALLNAPLLPSPRLLPAGSPVMSPSVRRQTRVLDPARLLSDMLSKHPAKIVMAWYH